MDLTLRYPAPEDESAVRALHEQLRRDDFSFVLDEGTWPEFLDAVERAARGTDLPPDRVRADFLLAEVDGRIVGRTSIRYDLTDHLRRVGGHVGYAVGPEFRRRGYATEILRQPVARLHAAGVERVLVTCADDNAASCATIESCGGVLEDVVVDDAGRPTRRYWIG
ncbi:GNAT family N-acetyltransferase [Kocuria tytonis]|uniref:GNAT family N-acetyltransferase n=1 Tax=Kocuria tytonis TaxID=2054280 RepID=A0A495A7M9_9MICC|nr:GNAT family N-acetyltransferase [Kocuria tytonis]RKQ35382.1 GNAT family N-acetyltransferase [Kocuria tytonis]